MKFDTPRVQRRVIGKVDVFDLFGNLEGELVRGIRNYIESYIKECKSENIVLNIQSVKDIGSEARSSIISILQLPKKVAVYSDSENFLEEFSGNKNKKIKPCSNQGELLRFLGKEMIERDKLIHFEERRRSVRFRTALDAKINFIDKEDKVVESRAIVTNLGEYGLFAEYFDLKSAVKLDSLDYFKNIKVKIEMQNDELDKPKVIKKQGSILRMEFSGKQVGVAIGYK